MSASTPELMIIVMGITGTGKSSFLKLLTRNKGIRISHSKCCTDKVEAYKAKVDIDGKTYTVTFVDTPGFDDGREGHDDASILREIALWLGRAYQEKTKVAGIIYLRRITDDRPTGAMRRSLNILRRMIGGDKLAIAHMVTNRWEVVKASGEEEKAYERERMLLGPSDKDYWHRWFGAHGAGYSRHDNTYASAIAIIQRLLQNTPAYIQIQTEITDKKLTLGDTSAGKVVIRGLAQKLQQDRKEIVAVEQEIKNEEDPMSREELRRLRSRVKLLGAQKQKLETESNKSLMESMKTIGLVTCGIVISAGGVMAVSTFAAGAVGEAVVSAVVAAIPRLVAMVGFL